MVYQPFNRYRAAYLFDVFRSLDEKQSESESFEAFSGEVMPKIFPQDEEGQAMRWSRFKTKDSRMIYDIVSTRVFPFIKTVDDLFAVYVITFLKCYYFLVFDAKMYL